MWIYRYSFCGYCYLTSGAPLPWGGGGHAPHTFGGSLKRSKAQVKGSWKLGPTLYSLPPPFEIGSGARGPQPPVTPPPPPPIPGNDLCRDLLELVIVDARQNINEKDVTRLIYPHKNVQNKGGSESMDLRIEDGRQSALCLSVPVSLTFAQLFTNSRVKYE